MRYTRISPGLISFANRITTRAKGTSCAAARAGRGRRLTGELKRQGWFSWNDSNGNIAGSREGPMPAATAAACLTRCVNELGSRRRMTPRARQDLKPRAEATRDSGRLTFIETREASQNGWLRSHSCAVRRQAVFAGLKPQNY